MMLVEAHKTRLGLHLASLAMPSMSEQWPKSVPGSKSKMNIQSKAPTKLDQTLAIEF